MADHAHDTTNADVIEFPVRRPTDHVDRHLVGSHPEDNHLDDGAVENPSLREGIGEVLRDERHRQDRTLADVADRAGVSLPYLSEVERGRKDVSSEVLEAVCRSLELEVPALLERTAERLRGTSGTVGAVFSLAA